MSRLRKMVVHSVRKNLSQCSDEEIKQLIKNNWFEQADDLPDNSFESFKSLAYDSLFDITIDTQKFDNLIESTFWSIYVPKK